MTARAHSREQVCDGAHISSPPPKRTRARSEAKRTAYVPSRRHGHKDIDIDSRSYSIQACTIKVGRGKKLMLHSPIAIPRERP